MKLFSIVKKYKASGIPHKVYFSVFRYEHGGYLKTTVYSFVPLKVEGVKRFKGATLTRHHTMVKLDAMYSAMFEVMKKLNEI